MSASVHRQTWTELRKSQSLRWNVLTVPLMEVTTFMLLVFWFWWLGIELSLHPSNAWFQVVHGVKRADHSELCVFWLYCHCGCTDQFRQQISGCLLHVLGYVHLPGSFMNSVPETYVVSDSFMWLSNVFLLFFFPTFISVPRLLTLQFVASLRGELGSQFLLLHNYCYIKAGPSCIDFVGKNGMIAHIGLHLLKEADLREQD